MRGFLFDFNGTLYDDSRLHMEAWRNFFREKFNRTLSDAEVRSFIGPSNADIFAKCFGGSVSAERVAELSAEKEAAYRAVARSSPDNLRLIDGVPEMLDLLVARKIPFALATSSVRANVDFYLEDLGLKRWFTLDRIVYEEGKLASKPDPAFYIEAARRIGLSPEDCTIVEDSPTGIQAAVNARAGRIVAIDRSAPCEWLEGHLQIDAIIHDFRGFERFI